MRSNVNIGLRSLITALGTGSALICSHAAMADYTVKVDPSVRYQTMDGWGTSLCWWSKVVGGFPEPARSDYIDKIFDPVKGLGLNIVRYNIGGGENPEYLAPNKQFLTFRTNMPGFEPSPGVWDWTADAEQRTVLQMAIKKGANIVQAFSNSPPYWMTVSGSVTGGKPDQKDNLDPAHYQDFADYLSTVTDHFRKSWGVTFDSLEPLNEPDGYWWKFGGHQEGCCFNHDDESRIIKAVGQSLLSSGSKTVLAATDENSINNTVKSVQSFGNDTMSYIRQIDTHSYNGSQRSELNQLAASNKKALWMSEYGDNDGTGIKMSDIILHDINEMHATAWITWQAVDGGGWGLLVNPEQDTTSTQYTINEKYYVLGQYSKFIRQGDVIIASDDPHSLTAWDARNRRLIIVTTNDLTFPTNVTYDLTEFPGKAKVMAYQTSQTQSLAQFDTIEAKDSTFTFALPASSVTTFVVSDIKIQRK